MEFINTHKTAIIISAISIVAIIVIIVLMQEEPPVVTVPVDTVPVAAVPVAPAMCAPTRYCNGVYTKPMPEFTSICGRGDGTGKIMQCMKDSRGRFAWVNTSLACPSTFTGSCLTPLDTCEGGAYCDNTPITREDAKLGALICGGPKDTANPLGIQYKCAPHATTGEPIWQRTGQQCVDTMRNACKAIITAVTPA